MSITISNSKVEGKTVQSVSGLDMQIRGAVLRRQRNYRKLIIDRKEAHARMTRDPA